jgi:hypothetical protein
MHLWYDRAQSMRFDFSCAPWFVTSLQYVERDYSQGFKADEANAGDERVHSLDLPGHSWSKD